MKGRSLHGSNWRAAVAAACSALAASCGDGGDKNLDPSLVYDVTRDDLVITVRERGELSASENAKIQSQVEGRPTLIYLIEEGKRVEKGEKLAELETTELLEKRTEEEVAVARAEAAYQQAKKNVEIMERELRAAESAAESQLRIAELGATKLMGEPRTSRTNPDDPLAGTNAQVIEALEELVEKDAEIEQPVVDAVANEVEAVAEEAGADGEDVLFGPSADDRSADESASGVATGSSPEGKIGSEALAKAARARRPVSPDLVSKAMSLFESESNLELQMGEMANLILAEVANINLARADLEVTAETLRYSEQLASEGFMTRGELTRDRIDYQRRIAEMSLAWNNLDLLVNYTLKERKITARQDVEDATLDLASVRASAEARRVREASDLQSAKSELEIAQRRLDNWNEQIENAVFYAPGPGLVVYGRYDWDEPVYEGMEIRKRQEIVVLPNVEWMIAELLVHEAQVDSVGVGQSATVTVDAFPDRTFPATVTSVSSLPDVRGSWRANIKVYSVQVDLDDPNGEGTLRPGMNSTIQIEVGTLEDVISIPQPALERQRDRYFVWLIEEGEVVAHEVEIGANNLTHVEITSGLEVGDEIYMVAPPGAELPDAEDGRELGDDDDSKTPGDNAQEDDDVDAGSSGSGESGGSPPAAR